MLGWTVDVWLRKEKTCLQITYDILLDFDDKKCSGCNAVSRIPTTEQTKLNYLVVIDYKSTIKDVNRYT